MDSKRFTIAIAAMREAYEEAWQAVPPTEDNWPARNSDDFRKALEEAVGAAHADPEKGPGWTDVATLFRVAEVLAQTVHDSSESDSAADGSIAMKARATLDEIAAKLGMVPLAPVVKR